MKQVLKDKLKELAILCFDKGVNFETHHNVSEDMDCVSWCAAYSSGVSLEYLSLSSELCADWVDSSEQRIDLCIQKVKEFER